MGGGGQKNFLARSARKFVPPLSKPWRRPWLQLVGLVGYEGLYEVRCFRAVIGERLVVSRTVCEWIDRYVTIGPDAAINVLTITPRRTNSSAEVVA